MTTQLREKYLEAFGVPAFLYTQNTVQNPTDEKIKVACLVIETKNARSFSQAGKYQDFLFKMLSAIDLKPSDIECISIQTEDLTRTLEQYQAQVVLLTNEDLTPSSKQHFVIHHPSTILANDAFKREAWEILKQIKACLK